MEKTLSIWNGHRDLLYLGKGGWDSAPLSALSEVTQLLNCRSGSAVQSSELAACALLAPLPTKGWMHYTAVYHICKDGYCLSCWDGRFARNHPNAHSLDAMFPMASICEALQEWGKGPRNIIDTRVVPGHPRNQRVFSLISISSF